MIYRGNCLKKPDKHTLDTANESLKNKGLDSFLTVVSIHGTDAILADSMYGEYRVDIKSFSASAQVPLHRTRKHRSKMDAKKIKYVGIHINGLKITDLFYGPDRGYKNRSFYLEYQGACGHTGVASYATMTKHKKTFICQSCAKTNHGSRGKEDGTRIKRTSTYNHWIKIKDTLPEELKDFTNFKDAVGEKPFKIADLRFVDGKPVWVNLQISDDYELNLMASALRQAFRYSKIYKDCVEASRIETEEGTRYKCAICADVAKRADIQVDHINPVSPIDGSRLDKDTLIDRVWTTNIQILDKKCHNQKSSIENAERRRLKKEAKK